MNNVYSSQFVAAVLASVLPLVSASPVAATEVRQEQTLAAWWNEAPFSKSTSLYPIIHLVNELPQQYSQTTQDGRLPLTKSSHQTSPPPSTMQLMISPV